MFPRRYKKNVDRICSAIGTSPDTAYAMMLLTATLMDLRPDDESVVDMILSDCGISPECA